MVFFKKSAVSVEVQNELRAVLHRTRFFFTSMAQHRSDVEVVEQPDFGQVVSSVPMVLLNSSFFFKCNENLSKTFWRDHLAAFRKKAVPAMICLPSEVSKDHTKSLEAAGAVYQTDEYDLALDIRRFNVPWFIPKSVTLEEAHDEASIKLWTDSFFENFRLGDVGRDYFMDLIKGRNSIEGIRGQFLLAKRKGKTIGTIALIHEGDIAAGFCVSIAPQARSMGIGTMLIASVLRRLKKTSCRYMVGNSNEAGYQIYRKAPSLIHLGKTAVWLFSDSQ